MLTCVWLQCCGSAGKSQPKSQLVAMEVEIQILLWYHPISTYWIYFKFLSNSVDVRVMHDQFMDYGFSCFIVADSDSPTGGRGS
jgi:hypothetical protein